MAASPAGWTKESLIEDRRSVIGYNCALNYARTPLCIVAGKRARLFDETGASYLDCVNNVCHVGHCHPDVVAAGAEQLAVLNTNSRYLSPFILEAAKRITRTMPAPLSVVYWVNSGSEANDLALRLARAYTRRRGVVCVDGAYHGHVTSIIDISPYKYARAGGAGLRSWVRCAIQPDVFSGVHRGALEDESLGEVYAADVARCVESLREAEVRETARRAAGDLDVENDGLTAGCGAFIMESILSCGGQVVPPAGYLRRVYAAVRAAGAVCIADEVQIGFGRVGHAFWGFQLQGEDVVPDIVTLGKPIGNGFPVAAVVTTPAIAAAFSNGMEYFNTFGGNPVAGRVSLAVMDVIEREGLQAHAAKVGEVLLSGFRDLYAAHPAIGSVRGVGLMVGLEILRDRGTREPWGEGASAVVYAMLRRHILLSTDGMHSNVIKLKPPMVFSEEDAHLVVRELQDVFAHLDEHVAAYKALPPPVSLTPTHTVPPAGDAGVKGDAAEHAAVKVVVEEKDGVATAGGQQQEA